MTNLELELAKSALWLERYSPEVLSEISAKLELAQKQILDLIAETQNKRTIRKEVNAILNDAFSTFDTVIADDIENINELAFNTTNAIMAGYVTSDLASKAKSYKDVSKLIRSKLNNPNTLVQGHTLQEHFSHLNRQTTMKIQGIILKGFDDGSGVEDINRNIRNTFGSLNRNQTKTLVVTSLLEASEKAQIESMDFFSEEILSWKYSSVVDNRRTPYCAIAHGYVTKDISKAKYKTKSHYRCRSMWIPETELSKELESDGKLVQWDGKTVNHRTGEKSTKFKVDSLKKVPKGTKGIDTLKYFDDEYLQGYLGKTRFRLYKDGKATLDEMFNISRGKMLTLEQLNKRLAKK